MTALAWEQNYRILGSGINGCLPIIPMLLLMLLLLLLLLLSQLLLTLVFELPPLLPNAKTGL